MNSRIKRLVLFSTFLFFSLNLFSQEQKYDYDQLAECVNLHNPEILKLQEEYKRSLLDVKDAWANLMPVIDFQATGTYMVNPPLDPIYLNMDDVLNSISWPTGTKPASTGQYVKIYDGMENSLYNIQATLTQPLFTWGKIGYGIKVYKNVSKLKLLQLQSQQKKSRMELDSRLAALYFLNKIDGILDEEKAYADQLVAHSEKAEQSGMILHQNVIEARIQAKELEIARSDLNEQINRQLLELSHLTGIEDIKWNQVSYEFDENEIERIMSMDRAQVEENALSGHQESIAMLTILQEVNDLSVKIAKASENWKPDFAFQMSCGYGGSRFPLFEENWLRKDDYTLNMTFAIKTTIFDGGKKLHDIARKSSEAATSQITQEDSRIQIKQTLSSNWNTADLCTMRMEYQDLKMETVKSKIGQQELVFKTGYGSETDLLTSKINYCNEQIEKEKQALNRSIACLTVRFLAE